jgi:hypothetical protein
LKSEQFNLAQAASKEFDSLKREMYVQMNAANHSQIIHITKQLLSIDYTDMKAHKILRQTYKIIGDTANASKYKTIQFGLMNSILQKGDGRSCETAWPVIQVEEEYFILEMVGAKLKEQTLVEDGGICDKMDFKVDGKNIAELSNMNLDKLADWMKGIELRLSSFLFWRMGICTTMVRSPVSAHKALTTELSIPPEIPTTKVSILALRA